MLKMRLLCCCVLGTTTWLSMDVRGYFFMSSLNRFWNGYEHKKERRLVMPHTKKGINLVFPSWLTDLLLIDNELWNRIYPLFH